LLNGKTKEKIEGQKDRAQSFAPEKAQAETTSSSHFPSAP
jgi:hypothetical protein